MDQFDTYCYVISYVAFLYVFLFSPMSSSSSISQCAKRTCICILGVRLHCFKIDTNSLSLSLSLSLPLSLSDVLPQCYLCTALLIFLPVFLFSFCVSVNEQLKWIAVLTIVLPFVFLLCLYFFITSTFYSLCTQI